ncbi:MAG: hypothetical protein ABFR95_06015 [Actinomycetota bacterium]
MRRSRFFASAALAATLVMSAPSAALAVVPEDVNPNCFGMGASQIARGEFEGLDGMGEHASTQETPRSGIANVARGFGFVHQSELASFLGAEC